MTGAPSTTGDHRPVVVLDALDKTYPGPPEVRALRRVDLEITAGDLLTIVGRSGSGKSTLLNVLGLLDRPTGGRYELNGVDVASLDEKHRSWLRATAIGFVFQSFHLLPDRSAVENVAMGLLYRRTSLRHARARALEALAKVGLADRAEQSPRTMSGGEQQRVAIARAVVGEPSILLCDEPTGNLDSENAAGVIDVVRTLSSLGTTVVVITHEPDIAAIGNRSIRLLDGAFAESTVGGAAR